MASGDQGGDGQPARRWQGSVITAAAVAGQGLLASLVARLSAPDLPAVAAGTLTAFQAGVSELQSARQEEVLRHLDERLKGLERRGVDWRPALEDEDFRLALLDAIDRARTIRGREQIVRFASVIAGSMAPEWGGPRRRLAENVWNLTADLSDEEFLVLRAAWMRRNSPSDIETRAVGATTEDEIVAATGLEGDLVAASVERLRGVGLLSQTAVEAVRDSSLTVGPDDDGFRVTGISGGHIRLTILAHNMFALLEVGGDSRNVPPSD